MNAQTIVTPAGERLVVLPEAEYEALLEAAEDAADRSAVEAFRRDLATGVEELLPVAVVDRILDGESRVRVWRQHRRASADALAEQAGIAPGALVEIEGGVREPTLDELRRLAAALSVAIDDLVG